MRLIRFGQKGKEKPGLWEDGRIVDLTDIFPDIPDINKDFFRNGWLEKVAQITSSQRNRAVLGNNTDIRLGCPVHFPSKIICLGKNYAEHAKEGNFENPEKPLIFCKTLNSLNGPFEPIIMPRSSKQIDWEVELAVIIGKQGKRINRKDAYDYIAGYTVMNDVSGRDVQFSDTQWFRGKSFDTFAPLGPAVVTPDEIRNVNNLRLTAIINGVLMQDGNTKDMVFDIPCIIENISEDITLLPGDIISTGTPSGVGIFRDPPVVLKTGDVVECRIEKIGSIINKCI